MTLKIVQVPIQNIPNQEFTTNLNGQNCLINLRQNGEGLFLSLTLDDTRIVSNLLCNNAMPMPVNPNSNFSGYLMFKDTLGSDFPNYLQLGTRFLLFYVYDEDDD